MLLVVYMLVTFLRALNIVLICVIGTTRMHNQMVQKLSRAKIQFFDSNPVGRVLTRFSKDTQVLDLLIPHQFILATFGMFRTITVAIVVCVIHPYMLVFIAICVLLMHRIIRSIIGPLGEA